MIAGLRGGRTEQAIMRLADAQMAFPDILLAIMMVAALGGSAVNLILVLGISRWMIYARVVFGLTRSLRQRPFVEAATLYGGGDCYIMRQHILPQVMPVLTVVATLQVAQMILQETALSYPRPRPAGADGHLGQHPGRGQQPAVRRALDRQLWPGWRSSCWSGASTCSATGCANGSTRAPAPWGGRGRSCGSRSSGQGPSPG